MTAHRPLFGRPKLGILSDWVLCTIFGGVVIRGWLDGAPFVGELLCFDGLSDAPTSIAWTDRGRVKVLRHERAAALLIR